VIGGRYRGESFDLGQLTTSLGAVFGLGRLGRAVLSGVLGAVSDFLNGKANKREGEVAGAE
jgi:hypothetical protein